MSDNCFIIHNGKKYVRVSSVLSLYTDFSSIPPEVLSRKARIGTAVHAAISEDIDAELSILEPACLGYFLSYRKWKERLRPRFLESERRYFDDEFMFSGCIDALICLEYENTPILVDFKTSASESPTWKLQAHLYAHLISGSGKKNLSDRYLFLKLDQFGSYPTLFEYKYSSDIHEFTINSVKKFWRKVENDSRKMTSRDNMIASIN